MHTLPLAHLIKQRWPDAYVAWAVEKGPSPLVQWSSVVDETIIVPKGFLKSPGQLAQVRRRLRSLKIDIALDPQSLSKSAVLAWLSGAKRRIGFARPIGRELAPWLNTTLVQPEETHVVRRYLEVLKPLGMRANEREIAFDLPHDDVSESTIRRYLAAMLPKQRFAVINPGAGWDSKLWPVERYAAVANALPLASVIVWSGDKERAWAQEIVANSGGKACLAPPTSLLELTALCRQAQLFIGSDTGPLHIAAAVGTRCVGIYGPTRPEVCGPFGAGHIVLQSTREDLGSSRKAAGNISDAMLQITPEQVVNASRRVLARGAIACRAA